MALSSISRIEFDITVRKVRPNETDIISKASSITMMDQVDEVYEEHTYRKVPLKEAFQLLIDFINPWI